MTSVGWATLSVIPSFQGFGNKLERGIAGPLATSSRKAGATAGAAASQGFSQKFQTGLDKIRPSTIVAGLGIAAIGKQIVGLQGEFQSSMNVLAESADVPRAQMRELASFAKQMGAQTVFSANEAADAMVELAKAGMTPATIQAGALKATMAVAATEGLGLAESATIMSNAMTTFGIEGGRASEVADALAGGSKASTASVASLSEAMSQVGGSARDAGLSLQETVAALAAFDQEGIKGSDAGTSLKTMLSRLVPQTKKAAALMENLGLTFTDANGAFLPLAEIAGRLRKSLSGLSDAERATALNTIFGSDARRAALALMSQGEGGIEKFTKATTEMGAAQALADARMKGTKGAIEEMMGALETAGLSIGEAFAPAVMQGARGVTSLTTGILGLPGPVKAAAGAFVVLKVAAAAGITSSMAAGVTSMSSAMTGLRIRTMLAGDAFRTARAGQLAFIGNSGTFTAPVGRMSASLIGLQAAAVGAGNGIRRGLTGAMGLVGGPWGVAFVAGTAAVTHFWQENQKAKQFVDDLTGSLDQQTGSLTENTNQLVFNALQKSGAIDAARKLGINLNDMRLAATGNEAAMRRVNAITSEFSTLQTSMSADAVIAVKNWIGVVSDQEKAADKVGRAINSTSGALGEAKAQVRDYAAFSKGLSKSNKETAGSFRAAAREASFFGGILASVSGGTRIQRGAKGTMREYATGGHVTGPGSGTSDSILARLSNGEFVQRQAAVDYYGVDFMRRLNAMQIPKYAQGGPVGPQRQQSPVMVQGGTPIHVGQVVAQDVNGMLRDLQRRQALSAYDGIPR